MSEGKREGKLKDGNGKDTPFAARAGVMQSANVAASKSLLSPIADEASWDFQLFPKCQDVNINHDRVLFEHKRSQIAQLLKSYDRAVREAVKLNMCTYLATYVFPVAYSRLSRIPDDPYNLDA